MRSSRIISALVVGFAFACSPTTQAPPADPIVVAPPTTASPAPTPATTAPVPSKSGPEGAMCGGIAGFGCAPGLYCSFTPEAHCGAADMSGVCQRIAEMCTEQYSPVCGCNDKTYPNACYAAREGISVGRLGACPPAEAPPAATSTPPAAPVIAEGQLCGTRGVNGECAPGFYCNFKSQCGATDSGGTCTKRTEMCTKIYAPVCGCDGKTYGSACVAAGAGVTVASKGECPKPKP